MRRKWRGFDATAGKTGGCDLFTSNQAFEKRKSAHSVPGVRAWSKLPLEGGVSIRSGLIHVRCVFLCPPSLVAPSPHVRSPHVATPTPPLHASHRLHEYNIT